MNTNNSNEGEKNHDNQIVEIDGSGIDIHIINKQGNPERPWLTTVTDVYSRKIIAYYLSFKNK
jgi:transposase InsO family protein